MCTDLRPLIARLDRMCVLADRPCDEAGSLGSGRLWGRRHDDDLAAREPQLPAGGTRLRVFHSTDARHGAALRRQWPLGAVVYADLWRRPAGLLQSAAHPVFHSATSAHV